MFSVCYKSLALSIADKESLTLKLLFKEIEDEHAQELIATTVEFRSLLLKLEIKIVAHTYCNFRLF